jgi:hypothetical protein
MSTEIRYFKVNNVKNSQFYNEDGEYWLVKAIEMAGLYLPSTCPIIGHYLSSYNKNYNTALHPIVN